MVIEVTFDYGNGNRLRFRLNDDRSISIEIHNGEQRAEWQRLDGAEAALVLPLFQLATHPKNSEGRP